MTGVLNYEPFVEPIDKGEGGSATRFAITLQDPQSADQVTGLLSDPAIADHLEPFFSVLQIEIALDTYRAGPDFVARQFWFSTNHVSDNKRLYWDFKGSGKAIPATLTSLGQYIRQGYQIGIGNENDDLYQHAYWKTTDRGGKVSLPPDEHRARFEIRLKGNALPCQTWDDWQCFKFESLAFQFFRFRRLKNDLTPAELLLAERRDDIGQRKTRNRRGGGTRLHSTWTKADAKLNELARDALKNLSKRWRATENPHQKRSAKKVRLAEIRVET